MLPLFTYIRSTYVGSSALYKKNLSLSHYLFYFIMIIIHSTYSHTYFTWTVLKCMQLINNILLIKDLGSLRRWGRGHVRWQIEGHFTTKTNYNVVMGVTSTPKFFEREALFLTNSFFVKQLQKKWAWQSADAMVLLDATTLWTLWLSEHMKVFCA